MSWYDSDYQKRASISVPNTAGSGTIDVDTTIPPEWDEFWNAIDTAGDAVRITSADGVTLVAYDVDKPGGGAFSRSTRAGRLRIDGATVPAVANSTAQFFVYFDPESTVADGSSAVTMSSILDGYIELGRPSARQLAVQGQPPGLTRPQALLGKGAGATEHYWLDVGPVLEVYRRPSEGHVAYEEIGAVKVVVYTDAGATGTSMEDHTGTRFVEIPDGRRRRMFVRIRLTAGTSPNRYTAEVQVQTRTPASTTTHRTIVHRTGLVVYDVLEPAG